MENFIVNHPLLDRAVYGHRPDGTKEQIGTITCITPTEWVMYWTDAKWQFVSCHPAIASSEAGTMEEAETHVKSWFDSLTPVAA